ncbi:aquaporin [Streptomyces sp. NPDC005349]|uniref:aquaporin n=1 Tax=Streptomyces sp. NPDC005349 TaxID=3157037 RepID=UPI00339F1F7C
MSEPLTVFSGGLGTANGGSANPARQFGPAITSGRLGFFWVYLLAPVVGAVGATPLRSRVLKRRAVLMHRLCEPPALVLCAGLVWHVRWHLRRPSRPQRSPSYADLVSRTDIASKRSEAPTCSCSRRTARLVRSGCASGPSSTPPCTTLAAPWR